MRQHSTPPNSKSNLQLEPIHLNSNLYTITSIEFEKLVRENSQLQKEKLAIQSKLSAANQKLQIIDALNQEKTSVSAKLEKLYSKKYVKDGEFARLKQDYNHLYSKLDDKRKAYCDLEQELKEEQRYSGRLKRQKNQISDDLDYYKDKYQRLLKQSNPPQTCNQKTQVDLFKLRVCKNMATQTIYRNVPLEDGEIDE